MIWDPRNESAADSDRKKQQLENMKALVGNLYAKVPFYRRKFEQAGLTPGHLQKLTDIALFPFTTKDELRETYPYGLLAVSPSSIVEVHSSSGTTGKPVVGAYTQGDIDLWSEVMARTLAMTGTTRRDVVQNAYGYGLFTGGLGVHYGARLIGANLLPVSAGNTKRQIMLLRDFGTTVLTCTPSYSLYLAEEAAAEGVDFSALSLKAGCFGAEPWSEGMRAEIEKKLCLSAHDIYGLTEIIGPGVAAECEAKDGLHVNEDYFYPEIIDPATGRVLPEGEKGELVFTTLTREGSPLLRYRTRDITFLSRGACPCGRTTVKMHRLFGRTDDMLIIRGVNVFPSQIEQVLMRIEGTEPHYRIVVDRGAARLDEIEVHVEVGEAVFSDETRNLEQLKAKIQAELRSELGVNAFVKLVEPKTIVRSEGKAQRIIDKRQL